MPAEQLFRKLWWEKEKLHITSNFSFSNMFSTMLNNFSQFFIKSKIVVCKTFSAWKSLQSVV